MLFWKPVNSPSSPTTSLFSGLLSSSGLQDIAFLKETVWVVLAFPGPYELVFQKKTLLSELLAKRCWLLVF